MTTTRRPTGKKNIRKAGKKMAALLLFAVLVLGGIACSARILRRTDSEYKYHPFFADDTEYDVIFYGTSHVLNAVHPMQLWKEHGIRAYNFGGHANSIAAAYWTLVLSCQYHKPQVAVLDMKGAAWDDTIMTVNYAHLSFDCFPLSRLKVRAICDIFPQADHRIELLVPFSIYHNRWSDPDLEPLKGLLPITDKTASPEKGAELRVNLAAADPMDRIPQKKKSKEETVSMQYVRRFIEYCRQEGITPLLINIPYPADKGEQRAANKIADIAQETGTVYLNMQYMDLVDFRTDMYDENSHLNASGAWKITAFMGRYLAEEMGLGVDGSASRDEEAARISEADQKLWDKQEQEYEGFLEEMVQELKLTSDIFVLLANDHFSAQVAVPKETSLSAQCRELAAAMGERMTITYTGEPFGAPAFKIYERTSGRLICEKQGEGGG